MNAFNALLEKFRIFLVAHKVTVFLALGLLLIISAGSFVFQNFNSNQEVSEEVDLFFDAEGPYALTYPRRDGNALVLNIKRTSSYDSISYDLAYSSTPEETVVSGNRITEDDGEGSVGGSIDRGVSGTIETGDKKGEYEQEILFGTCSKQVCKYDKGVENGTLTLHIRKGNKAYRMVTLWHLQKPDLALGNLTSGDNHFSYKVDAKREELNAVGFSITQDLTGVPKLPNGKEVLGKVYALNVPTAKDLPHGDITLELAESPAEGALVYRFNESKNDWEEIDTKIDGSKLSGKAEGAGIFAVLTPKK